MHVMTLEEWKERTYISKIHVRSDKMRAIDNALKRFHQTQAVSDLSSIRQAIDAWKRSHENWEASKRNRDSVIDDLYTQTLTLDDTVVMSPAEREAMKYVVEATHNAHRRLFEGSKLSTKTLSVLTFANSFKSNCSTAKKGLTAVNNARRGAQGAHQVVSKAPSASHLGALSGVSNVIKPGLVHAKDGLIAAAHPAIEALQVSSHLIQQAVKVAHDLINQLVPIDVIAEVVRELLQPLIMEFAHTLAPYIGMAKSGATAVSKWGKAAVDLYRMHWTTNHNHSLGDGGPQAAFEAMQKIIERELASHVTSATVSTIDAVTRAALIAADYGAGSQAIVGGVTALANLTHSIFLAGRDYYERHQANKVLKDPDKIDLFIFETHPILGCYFLTSADTSALLQIAIRDFGKVGWQGSVASEVRRHLAPLQALSTEYIDNCRFELLGRDGLPFKGAFYKGGLGKLKQGAVRGAKREVVGIFKDQRVLSPSQLKGIGSKG